jgi:hypothetical protein
MKQSLTKPIFIVGLPRTGSKLMMNIITNNTIADYHIANEVQFFGHSFLVRVLQGRRGVLPIVASETDGEGRISWQRVVERLYSGEVQGAHWDGLAAGRLKVPKSKLRECLTQSGADPKSIYEAILSTQEREHRAYGDKSGPNLYFIDKLLKWFPDCRVIHIIRDPRAILTSQHRRLMMVLEHRGQTKGIFKAVKRLCYSPTIVLYILAYWGYAIRLDRRYAASHPRNYMMVQYEKLILKPEETTRRICEFLSIRWDRNMLAPPKSDSSYIDPLDIHKTIDRGTGMDREAMNRWRQHIRPWMLVAFKVYGSVFYPSALKRLGYSDGGPTVARSL